MRENLAQAEQIKLFSSLNSGDLFKFGELFPGMSDRQVEWQLVERINLNYKGQPRERFLFRMYYLGVLLGMIVAFVADGKEIEWSVGDDH